MTGTIRSKPTRNCPVKGYRVRTRVARARIRASNYSESASRRRENRQGRRIIVDDQSDERNIHIDQWDPEYQFMKMADDERRWRSGELGYA